jgi:hypothetical protein
MEYSGLAKEYFLVRCDFLLLKNFLQLVGSLFEQNHIQKATKNLNIKISKSVKILQ